MACATCNGDEKLNEHWRTFLERKVADPDVRAARTKRIEAWVALHPPLAWAPSPEVEALVQELDGFVEEFGVKCAQLRERVAIERAAAQAT